MSTEASLGTDGSLDGLLQSGLTSGVDGNELMFSFLSQSYPEWDLVSFVPASYNASVNQITKPLVQATSLVQFQNSFQSLNSALDSKFSLLHQLPHGGQQNGVALAQNGDHSSEHSSEHGSDHHHHSESPESDTSTTSEHGVELNASTMASKPSQSNSSSSSHSSEHSHSLDEDDDPKLKRREQIKKASKLYRARKKQSEKHMEAELEKLRAEKEQLLREKENALRQVQTLQNSVNSHRSAGIAHASEMERAKMDLLTQLKAVYQSDTCTNEALVAILKPLRDVCKVISGVATCYAQHLISVANSIVLARGFLEDCTYLVETEQSSYGIGMFYNKLLHSVPSVSSEQRTAMSEIVSKYYADLSVLHAERKELSLEMIAFEDRRASSLGGDSVTLASLSMQRLTLLDCLRRNLHTEVNLHEGALDAICTLLTPRQLAQFMLKVDIQSTSVLMLQGISNRLEQQHSMQPLIDSEMIQKALDYQKQRNEQQKVFAQML